MWFVKWFSPATVLRGPISPSDQYIANSTQAPVFHPIHDRCWCDERLRPEVLSFLEALRTAHQRRVSKSGRRGKLVNCIGCDGPTTFPCLVPRVGMHSVFSSYDFPVVAPLHPERALMRALQVLERCHTLNGYVFGGIRA